MRAQPKVNFYTQVSLDADDRRRRLQERTGYTMPQLVSEALKAFGSSLDVGSVPSSAAGPDGTQPAAV
jgi:hypothetical protein